MPLGKGCRSGYLCSVMNAPTLINRSMAEEPDMAASAAELLRSDHALGGLSMAEARCVVSYMRLLRCAEGQVLMREGEPAGNGFMLLILDGEVTVDNVTDQRVSPRVVSVLGPGHLVGETALIDGGPRTATCTATTRVIGAGLSRGALGRLTSTEPLVAAKLLQGVARRMAERLRDLTRQQRVYHQLVSAMQQEVHELQTQLQHVMEGSLARAGRTDTGSAPS